MLLLGCGLIWICGFLDVDDEFGLRLILIDGPRWVMDLVAIYIETASSLSGASTAEPAGKC